MTTVNVAGSVKVQSIFEALNHKKLKHLLTLTPAQLDTWINDNVLDLEDAKNVLIAYGVIINVLAASLEESIKRI